MNVTDLLIVPTVNESDLAVDPIHLDGLLNPALYLVSRHEGEDYGMVGQ
jgi:hypothetical protein